MVVMVYSEHDMKVSVQLSCLNAPETGVAVLLQRLMKLLLQGYR